MNHFITTTARESMKTNDYLSLLALVVTAWFLMSSTGIAQSVDVVAQPKNRAIANSPRFLEEHPALLRTPLSAEALRARAQRRTEHLAKLTRNRALAASPRFLEEHPELLRKPPTLVEIQGQAERMSQRLHELRKNTAVAASPRVIEEFPALRFRALD